MGGIRIKGSRLTHAYYLGLQCIMRRAHESGNYYNYFSVLLYISIDQNIETVGAPFVVKNKHTYMLDNIFSA